MPCLLRRTALSTSKSLGYCAQPSSGILKKSIGDFILSRENGENIITEKICINAEMIMHIRTEESILGANEDFD